MVYAFAEEFRKRRGAFTGDLARSSAALGGGEDVKARLSDAHATEVPDAATPQAVSYTHLTLPTTPYV